MTDTDAARERPPAGDDPSRPLALAHPHARDARIEFREREHIYVLDGSYVFPRSVSRLVGQCFEEFQSAATARRCVQKWRADPASKYHALIRAAEAELPVAPATLISAAWGANGAHKSELGRMMHLAIECALNGVEPAPPRAGAPSEHSIEEARRRAPRVFAALAAAGAEGAARDESQGLRGEEAAFLIIAALRGNLRAASRPLVALPPAARDSPEMRAWRRWRRTAGARLVPIRTEWSVFSTEHDIAGQIDALFRCADSGRFVLVDWKRVDPMPKETDPRWPRRGRPPLEDLPDTKFWHYALQVNIYAHLLERFYKVPVAEMRLVQIHPNLCPEPGFVEHPVARMPAELLERVLAMPIARAEKARDLLG